MRSPLFLAVPFVLLACRMFAATALEPLPKFPLGSSPIAIWRDTEPAKPFTVAGEHGAILGQQNGECEAWVFPVKVLSHLRITAELKDYPVPIDVNDLPGAIEDHPGANDHHLFARGLHHPPTYVCSARSGWRATGCFI